MSDIFDILGELLIRIILTFITGIVILFLWAGIKSFTTFNHAFNITRYTVRMANRTYYTSEYTVDQGCLVFTDKSVEPSQPTRICGQYAIEDRQ